MSIVWIASYPKSGNTWVRFMLYAAIYGLPERSGDVPSKIPDIHRQMPFEKPESGPTYVKTHFELTDKHPKLDDTLKAIHILRNPRDILLSALNYRKLAGEGSWSLSKKRYANAFLKVGGDPDWKKIGFGTWASHARSWRTTERFSVLGVSYENLKADPHGELIRMLAFLDVERSQEEIDQAVVASSFDTMRALEIREKNTKGADNLSKNLFVGTKDATRKGIFFMNEGKSNQSLDTLYQGLDESFDARFKDALAEFGYGLD